MSFLSDLGSVALAPVTGGLSLGALGSEDGLVGELGNALLGSAGQIDPNAVHTPDAPMFGFNTMARDDLTQQGIDLSGMGRRAAITQSTAPQARAAGPQAGAQLSMGDLRLAQAQDAGTRATQVQNLGSLTAAAEGRVPSAAEIQQDRGTEAALQNAQAIANSARGGAAAQVAAQRNAQNVAATTAAGARQEAAALRANEQAAARQALTGAIQGTRASDLGFGQLGLQAATHQAGFDQQALLQNQLLQQQANLLNPRLALDSREQDRLRAEGLLNAGLNATKAGVSTGIAGEQLNLQHQGMLTDRDLAIQGANVGAENQRTGAILGAVGSGLGLAFA